MVLTALRRTSKLDVPALRASHVVRRHSLRGRIVAYRGSWSPPAMSTDSSSSARAWV